MSPSPDKLAPVPDILGNNAFFSVVLLLVMGVIARRLLDDGPISFRRFFAEILLAFLTGVVFYTFGVLQGLTTAQIILCGGLGGLGSVRMLEWAIKIALAVRRAS